MMNGQRVKESDFTAANSMPLKLVRNWEILYDIKNKGKIPCYHVQMILTNKCNLNCSFCSCRDDDRKAQMPFEVALHSVFSLKRLGMKAITITGGGEPLLYPKINEFISFAHSAGTDVGLVTNGICLYKLNTFKELTWCRISFADERKFDAGFEDTLIEAIQRGSNVDWAFSYVVSKSPNIENIEKVIEFANKFDFTHVRLVTDIHEKGFINLTSIKKHLMLMGIDDSKVIYQQRHSYTKGGPCYIGYLKPVIGADGNIYVCCGAQYAIHEGDRKMADKLCIGHIKNIEKIMSTMVPFDGSICDKCYYREYNQLLGIMVDEGKHERFV
jgi:MoaA/NifB/PqqE/SkfB family radical SAM enzyme